MVTKLGRAELSHARWIVGREGEHKVCAFTDDERHIMIVMQSGQFYKLPIIRNNQPVVGDQSLNNERPQNLLGEI